MGVKSVCPLSSPEAVNDTICYTEYTEWLKSVLENAFTFARKIMQKKVNHQKINHDRKAKSQTFDRGDWVWYFYAPAARQKLGYGWQGPYLVICQLGPVTYRVQKEEHSLPKVVHSSQLKPYVSDEMPQSWLPSFVSVSTQTNNISTHRSRSLSRSHLQRNCGPPRKYSPSP